MSYKSRKKARKFFLYLTNASIIGFFLSFMYILGIAGMSDNDVTIDWTKIIIQETLALISMGVSFGLARFGLYGFDIQDSWIKYIRRKHRR